MAMRGAAAYESVMLESTPQDGVVARVLDRAASLTAVAERAIGARDVAAAHDALVRAQLAVTALRSALRPEVYPELAANLAPLYDYLVSRLARANFAKDASELADLRQVLTVLHEAWLEATVRERGVS
jgi:flagellar protein FliS